jgi:HAD superfamily hydrolase (TIGR01509 family)
VSDLELVIFDCDGVLVDSERLAVRTEAAILASLGWPLTEDEIVERFVGRSARYMHAEVERHLGRPVDWEDEFERRYRTVFEQELTPVDGIVAALDAIDLPVCVASSGSHDKMAFTLGLTGLYDRFAGRIFSADEVPLGKPAPDVFLLAARRMGMASRRTAVVEDSTSGVAAGRAAGMRVFAFAGGVTPADRLTGPGVVVFDDMRMLPGLLTGPGT